MDYHRGICFAERQSTPTRMSANDPQPASARPANAGCGAAPCSADDLLAMCLSRFETIQETHPEIALDAEVSLLTEYLNRAPNPPPYHYSGEQWQHPDCCPECADGGGDGEK